MPEFWTDRKVCVTGGAGFLGRAVCARLAAAGANRVFVPRSSEYNLTQADDVQRMLADASPDVIIHLAAEVGGIAANRERPGRFFYANMAMGLHLIESAREQGVEKFVQVGTVCAYPKACPVPFREDDLHCGYPEATNAPYGIAKRALGVMIDAYRREYDFPGIYLIPVNLYGPGDNPDLHTSHVIPALIRKCSTAAAEGASRVSCWGSGTVSREFLFVDDAAEAIVLAAERHDDSAPINLGTGAEITIKHLAGKIARLCGFSGEFQWDPSYPDGQPRRRLDTARAAERLGWRARVSLDEGLARTVAWWKANGSAAPD